MPVCTVVSASAVKLCRDTYCVIVDDRPALVFYQLDEHGQHGVKSVMAELYRVNRLSLAASFARCTGVSGR